MTSSITFSLAPLQSRPSFTETARETIRDLRNMSTQTQKRIELLALIVGLVLTVSSALKVFVFLPPRVDAHDTAIKEVQAELKVVQAKASASDVAVAEMKADVRAIAAGITRIESDVRDIRNNAK
jgi:hypothetical protein